MKQVLLLNLSPRGKVASSFQFLHTIKEVTEERNATRIKEVCSYRMIMNNESRREELFEELSVCDVCVVAFPLYVDTLPAIAQHFVESYAAYFQEHKPTKHHDLYTIVNCGFPEAEQNAVALEIFGNFAKETGFTNVYRLGIGMGALLGEQKKESKLRKNLEKEFEFIVESISQNAPRKETKKNCYVTADFGFLNRWKESLYTFLASSEFMRRAKANQAHKKIYDKPYKK